MFRVILVITGEGLVRHCETLEQASAVLVGWLKTIVSSANEPDVWEISIQSLDPLGDWQVLFRYSHDKWRGFVEVKGSA